MDVVAKTRVGASGDKLYFELKRRMLRGDYAPNMKLPSVRELAKKYQVGTATVSRVLSQLAQDGFVTVCHGKGAFVSRVDFSKEDTLKIVMLYFCQSETGFSSHTSPFGMSCLQTSRRFCLEHNYLFVHRPIFPNADHIRKVMNELCPDTNVGGFIVLYAGNDYFSEYAKILGEFSKPVVFIDNPWRGRHKFSYVCGDDLQLGVLAARYLYGLGHKRIVYIMWDVARCFRDRLLGFRTELVRQGEELREDMILKVHSLDEERHTIDQLVDQLVEFKQSGEVKGRMTAVYCDKDRTALALIEKCRTMGISVPEDLSVMGGTGSEVSAHYTPSLTVSYVSSALMAERACEILVELIENPGKEPIQEVLEGVVVERESTCKVSDEKGS